ncbi:hypothetical protein G6F65_021323 [Rhizopus arrhizus]|nr:hypothetical protein G6F65_021323 [Rhizopus arrhizus]
MITIVGEDARDFDDAVYCEPVELGTGQRKRPGWRLLVAIADRLLPAPRHSDAARDAVQWLVFAEPRRGPPGAGLRHGDSGHRRQGRHGNGLPVLQRGDALACPHHLHEHLGGLAAARRPGRRGDARRHAAGPAPVRAVPVAGAGPQEARRH